MPGSVSETPFKFAKRAMVEELSEENGELEQSDGVEGHTFS